MKMRTTDDLYDAVAGAVCSTVDFSSKRDVVGLPDSAGTLSRKLWHAVPDSRLARASLPARSSTYETSVG